MDGKHKVGCANSRRNGPSGGRSAAETLLAEEEITATRIAIGQLFARRVELGSWLILLFVALAAPAGCQLAARNHNMNGVDAYQSGQLSKAINDFQLALTRDPQNADAYYNLAASYYSLGKQSNNQQWIQQAEQLYRQSIALNERHVAAHRGLAALLVETNRQRYAFDLLQAWQQRHPEMSDPLVEIARLHQEFGDVNRAGDYLADALRIDSGNPRVLKAMGYIREQQGQYALALENYYRSYQQDTRQIDVAQKINELQTRLASVPNGWNQPGGVATPPRF